MKVRFFSWVVSVVIVWLSTSSVFAADATRGIEIRPKSVVVSLKGSVSGAQSGKLGFRHDVPYGERIRTGENSYAGILLGDSAVVLMLDNSEIELAEESQSQVIKLYGGTVRLAVAGSKLASDQAVIVETPSARTVTRGTLAEVDVSAGTKKAALELGGRNLVRVMAAASQASSVENFNVFEGSMEISTPGNPPVNVAGGQATQVTNGAPGQPILGSGTNGFVPDLLADQNHGQTPQPLLQSMSNDQMAQAQALGSTIAGEKGSGTTLAEQNQEQIVIASASPSPGSISPSGPAFFGRGSNPFGDNPNSINFSGGAYLDDHNDTSFSPAHVGSASFDVKGGPGSLLFTAESTWTTTDGILVERHERSNINSTAELLLVDGGDRKEAPHGGIPPLDNLLVGGLNASNQKLDITRQVPIGPGFDSFSRFDVLVASKHPVNQLYIIRDLTPEQIQEALGPGQCPPPTCFEAFDINGSSVLASNFRESLSVLTNEENPSALLPTSKIRILDVASMDPSQITNLSLYSADPEGALFGFDVVTCTVSTVTSCSSSQTENFLNAAITARSPTTGTVEERRVTLEGGVVLDKETTLTVGTIPATTGFFGPSPEYDGSVIGVIAKDDNPAFVKIKDRALGVLGGSTIAPQDDSKIALLSVLDSQLIGPDEVPEERTGDAGVPPLLEIVESKPPAMVDPADPNDVGVNVTSAVVVRRSPRPVNGVVDEGLLKASAPLAALIKSTMRTSGNFADFSGPGLLLDATLIPGDALVRLDNANLMVNGHAFSFTDGATANITGNMASLTNGSNFSIQNGAFLNVGVGSTVNLNGSFALFGDGINQISVANSLCGASCTMLNGALPVAGAGTINGVKLDGGSLNLNNGFVPFRSGDGKATNANGTARVNLNNSPNTAFLQVNGALQLKPR